MEHVLTFFAIAICFGILFNVPVKYLPYSVAVGCTGGLTHRYLAEVSDIPLAAVIAAFLIGSISHGFARYTSQPAQIFLVPGVIVLVPGTKIHQVMAESFTTGGQSAMNLIPVIVTTAISISFGLLLANWLVPSRREL